MFLPVYVISVLNVLFWLLLTVTVLAEPLYIKSVGAVTVKSSSTRDAALISYVLFPAIVTLYLLLEAVTVIGYDPTLDVEDRKSVV